MPITEKLSTGGGWKRWGFAAASVVVHAGLLAALVMATAEDGGAAVEESGDEEVTFVDIRQFAPPPPPAASAPAQQPEPEPVRPEPRTPQPEPQPPTPEPPTPPRATDLIDPVDSLPDDPLGADVPPEPVEPVMPTTVEPTTSRAGSQSGSQSGGVEGGVEGGKEGGVVGGQGEEVPEPGGTYIAAVVDRKAELANRGDLPRLMRRLYPTAQRDAGIGGRVVVQFVVMPNGRVDMGTLKVLSATDDAFVGPTRQAVKEFRFTPARMGSQTVRMLTQLPIVWEVAR